MGSPQSLDLPAVAVVAFDQGIGGFVVGDLAGFAVEFEPLAREAVGDGADEDAFGQRAAVAEVIAALFAGEDGIHPVVVVVLAFETFGVFFSGERLLRQDEGALAVGLEDGSLGADPEGARGGELGEDFGHFDLGHVGLHAAIVPGDADGIMRGVFAAWEVEFDNAAVSPKRAAAAAMREAGTGGSCEFEGIKGGIKMMATHVPHFATAKVEPSAPGLRMIGIIQVRDGAADAAPEIPVQAFWNGVGLGTQDGVFWPPVEGLVFPHDDFLDLADGTALDELDGHAGLDARATLIAELRDDARFFGLLGDDPALMQRRGHGLLQIDVFVCPQGGDTGASMAVVRCAYGDGVKFIAMFGHELAPIFVLAGVFEVFGCHAEVLGIYVADADDLHLWVGGDAAHGVSPHAGDADAGDLEHGIRRGAAQDRREA